MPKIKKLPVIISSLVVAAFLSLPGLALAAGQQANLPPPDQTTQKLKDNATIKDINTIVTFGGGAVGLVVVANVVVGGIQYTMAGGNPQAAANARKRIANSLLAFVAFLLIWIFVQWLVPGGVFG